MYTSRSPPTDETTNLMKPIVAISLRRVKRKYIFQYVFRKKTKDHRGHRPFLLLLLLVVLDDSQSMNKASICNIIIAIIIAIIERLKAEMRTHSAPTGLRTRVIHAKKVALFVGIIAYI